MQFKVDRDAAEAIALKALSFIARDEEIFTSFLQISGASPQSLKDGLSDRFFLAGVMAFLLSQEPLLIEFCQFEKLDPFLPGRAHAILAGTDKDINFI